MRPEGKRVIFTDQHIRIMKFVPPLEIFPQRPPLLGDRYGVFHRHEDLTPDEVLVRAPVPLAPPGLSEWRGVVTLHLVGDPTFRGTFNRLPDGVVSAFVLQGRF